MKALLPICFSFLMSHMLFAQDIGCPVSKMRFDHTNLFISLDLQYLIMQLRIKAGMWMLTAITSV